MADVFVSYSRSDRARVLPLVTAIEARGWSVWWDPEIAPGQEFDRRIAVELAAAGAVLVVWTPASVESRWVRGEAREAADRGILVPVRFDHARLPIDVRALHTIDMDTASVVAGSPQVQGMLQALARLLDRAGDGAALAPPAARIPAGAAPPEPARVTIAVLPFANHGDDPGQAWFSDGVCEDILTELSRWRLLAVRSRAAAFRYRGLALDLRQVARELDVRYLVEGSVRRLGKRLRISVQLVDANSGSQLWAEKYDRDADEIFGLQDEVVQTIVATLVGRMQMSDAVRAARKPPASLAAYECVLRGNAQSWGDPAGNAEATRLFQQAIELDPDYGIAYALLAAIRLDHWREDLDGSDAGLGEVLALAQRAVELDPNDSTCHSILGFVHLSAHRYELALQCEQRAVELNPGNQWNRADMGFVLAYIGEPAASLASLAHAREIDPYFDPPWYWRCLGLAHLLLHRYAEALAQFEHAPLPRHFRVCAMMAGCLAHLGDYPAARASVAACLARKPDFTVARFMAKEPFRRSEDSAHLEALLRHAGFAP